MRVLVTGGAGFIGSHVVDRLLARGYVPRVFDQKPAVQHPAVESVVGDICDLDAFAASLDACDAIVHLAAVADVSDVLADPAHATRVNVQGTQVVLDAARAAGTGRVVFGSTVWVYGDAADGAVIDENAAVSLPKHPYTATKLAGEMLVHAYADLFGLDATILRFGIPFGPRARAATVVASLVARARAGKPLELTGDGTQRRQFVYVEDLAEGVVASIAAESAAKARIYNLVGDESVSVIEIAELVRELVAQVPIVHTRARVGDLWISWVSAARAERELGWRALTPFAEGMRRYIASLTETNGSPVRAAASRIDGSAATVLRQEAGGL